MAEPSSDGAAIGSGDTHSERRRTGQFRRKRDRSVRRGVLGRRLLPTASRRPPGRGRNSRSPTSPSTMFWPVSACYLCRPRLSSLGGKGNRPRPARTSCWERLDFGNFFRAQVGVGSPLAAAFGAACSGEGCCQRRADAHLGAEEIPEVQPLPARCSGRSRPVTFAPKLDKRGPILKKLVAEGVLLPNGQPNPNNDKVRAIAARPRKKKK